MIKLTCLEKNVSVFHTPYCDIFVTDENGNNILFDVMDSPEETLTVYIDNDENKEMPVIYGAGKTLRIYTKSLEIKKNYYIRPSVKLEYRDADERLITYGLTGETFTFALSYPEPNETIKDGLAFIDGEFVRVGYSEEDFVEYNIEAEDNSFVLRLYDRSNEVIDLFTFWIWNIQDHMEDYESACDVATWWCP